MYDHIKTSLDRLEIPYNEGDFLSITAQAESDHLIEINFTPPAEFAEYQILEVWGMADVIASEEALEAAHYEELLKENFTWPLGSWMLRPVENGLGLCFSIKLVSNDCTYPDAQIHMAIQGILHVVASMQEDMGISPQ